MKKYTTLLLDADGTLLDFDATEKRALKETFSAYGYPFNAKIEQRYLEINKVLWNAYEEGTMTREEVIYTRFSRLFFEMKIKDDGIAFEDDYQKALGRGHDLIAHAYEIVKLLSEEYDLYIASNGVVETQYQRLKESWLYPFFKGVFISEELGFQKPRTEYFTACFQNIKERDKKKILMVGDSLSSDIQGGINAGIDTCWFNPTHKINDKGFHSTYEIEHLGELMEVLGKEAEYE